MIQMDYNEPQRVGEIMNSHHIRKATPDDLAEVLSIYSYARRFMAEHGNPHQWGTTKPTASELEEDIRKGDLYVLEIQGDICGVFAFILGDDPTYEKIFDGCWNHDLPYGTIHRIAGKGSGGILHACVTYCEKLIPYLRIDTHHDNHIMQNAVAKEGFSRCGIIYIADGTPRIAHDRKR